MQDLIDGDDLIAQKIRKAKTDPEPLPDSLDELGARPEARNLVGIYAGLAEREPAAVLQEFAGQGFGAFKPALAELAVETLRPIRVRLEELRSDPAEIDRLLAKGAARAAAMAEPTLKAAYEALGLSRG